MQRFLKGFVFAGQGLLFAMRERNFRFHLIAAALAIILGVTLRIPAGEWLWIIISIVTVFCAEMLNTAVEDVCNHLRDDLGLPYEASKRARDVAAGAVLVVAIGAALIGFIIFLPRLGLITF